MMPENQAKNKLALQLEEFLTIPLLKDAQQNIKSTYISSIFSPEDRSLYREPRGPLDLRVRRRVGRLHPGEMLPQP